MSTIRTDIPAIVLDSKDYGESDKIVTFLCQDIGKLTTIAKGAHRSRKRFVNKLELFSFLHITCSIPRSGAMVMVTEADLRDSFIQLRKSVHRFQAASVIREIALLSTSERLQDDHLFMLLLWALQSLEQNKKTKNTVALFLVRLFDCIGYRLDFSGCRNCGAVYHNHSSATLNLQAGGLICRHCQKSRGITGRQLSGGAVQTFASIQNQPLQQLEKIKISGPLLVEILDITYRYSRHLFQREIHSWKQFLTSQHFFPQADKQEK